jgi:hypothetical protein
LGSDTLQCLKLLQMKINSHGGMRITPIGETYIVGEQHAMPPSKLTCCQQLNIASSSANADGMCTISDKDTLCVAPCGGCSLECVEASNTLRAWYAMTCGQLCTSPALHSLFTRTQVILSKKQLLLSCFCMPLQVSSTLNSFRWQSLMPVPYLQCLQSAWPLPGLHGEASAEHLPKGSGRLSGMAGARLCTPTCITIWLSLRLAKGGLPVAMCTMVQPHAQMSTVGVSGAGLPAASTACCSGDLLHNNQ